MSTFFQVPGLLALLFSLASLDIHDRHPFLLQPSPVVARTQTFLVTAYTPDSGDGISGSGAMASGRLSYVGAAACPMRLRIGTRVTLAGAARRRAESLGLPWELTCEDRFRNVYREGIDINLPLHYRGLNNQERIRLAKQFGLVKSEAIVYGNH